MPTGWWYGPDACSDGPRDRGGVVVRDGGARCQLRRGDEVRQRRRTTQRTGHDRGVDHPAHVVVLAQQRRLDPRRVPGIGGPQAYRPTGRGRDQRGDDAEDGSGGAGLLVERPGGEQVQFRGRVGRAAARPRDEQHLEARPVEASGGRQVDGDQRVITEVAPDATEIDHRVDADLAQRPGRPDPAAQEDRRTAVRPGGEHDARGLEDVAAGQPDAAYAGAVEQDLVHEVARADREVAARPGRCQVGQRGAHPDAVAHVAGHRTDTLGPRVVEVAHPGLSRGDRGLRERELQRGEIAAGRSPDRDRPAGAVPLVVTGGVRLDGTEGRQQVVERPARVSGRRPPVVVGRPAAQQEGGVGGRTPADQLGPRQRDLAAEVARLGDESPVVVEGRLRPVGDVIGQVLPAREVGPRLQQEHRAAAVLTQPGRDDATGGAGAHDDHVIGHADHRAAGALTLR